MEIPHHVHKLLVIETEPGKLLDMIDIRDLTDHFIIHTPQPVHPLFLLAGVFHADHDLVALFPLLHKDRDHFHRILEIRAHTHHTVAVGLFHAVDRRTGLSEIPGVEDRLDLFVFTAESPKKRLGIVPGMIVYKEDLVIIITEVPLHHLHNGFCQGDHIGFLIVGGDHHRYFLLHVHSPAFIHSIVSRIPCSKVYSGINPVSPVRVPISAQRFITAPGG